MNIFFKLSVTAIVICFSLFTACNGDKILTMETTRLVPAAVGSISIKNIGKHNTRIKVKVRHLAKPASLSTASSTYAVWVEPANGTQAQNVGSLSIDKDLEGEIATLAPYQTMRIFITAEKQATATVPSREMVLSTGIQ